MNTINILTSLETIQAQVNTTIESTAMNYIQNAMDGIRAINFIDIYAYKEAGFPNGPDFIDTLCYDEDDVLCVRSENGDKMEVDCLSANELTILCYLIDGNK